MRKSQEALAEIFGSHVFSDAVMRLRLPKNIYRRLRETIENGAELEADVAEVVAAAMKDWAVELGATHYSHWFSPMRGMTAEKHDSFISPNGDGDVILEFSGKELLRGEPDASSFPSGGLRATFEARGYTAWDCTSPAFVKEDPSGTITLCSPTAFCSYNGEALDAKTPLMRSIEALSRQAVRVLKSLGRSDVSRVTPSVGIEQEYFLVDLEDFRKRPDLIYCGRTLFGAPPPKGQEMDDQYYGVIRPRVSEFMADLNEELWKLGVPAKTEHNEAAPAQHEIAIVYASANIAVDHNQLVMEQIRKVALRHGFASLLHEKPFAGISGSGKHNNWSMATDTGENLLSPVKDGSNLTFLVFFVAVIAALDEYAPLVRRACAQLSNDERLGGHEAPPTILSAFIGEEMTSLIDHIEAGELLSAQHRKRMSIGVGSLPLVRRDTTDRNRTSPFAFTGNKFELRMPGSSMQTADANTTLNTIVAEHLSRIADRLESAADIEAESTALLQELCRKHRRILYDGNNYTKEWRDIAAQRGLPDLRTSVDAIPALGSQEAIALFERHGVLSRAEIESRMQIDYETYIKSLRIEARTAASIARGLVVPAAIAYIGDLCLAVERCERASIDPAPQRELAQKAQSLLAKIDAAAGELEARIEDSNLDTAARSARYGCDVLLPALRALRAPVDELERIASRALWPMPSYGDMLFYQD